jgi:hypothetical protein
MPNFAIVFSQIRNHRWAELNTSPVPGNGILRKVFKLKKERKKERKKDRNKRKKMKIWHTLKKRPNSVWVDPLVSIFIRGNWCTSAYQRCGAH